MATGIGNMIRKALAEQQQEISLPEGGILSLINQDEIAKQVKKEQDEEATRQLQIELATNTATKLANQIVGIEHFFVAGQPDFVAHVQQDPKNPARIAYEAILRMLQIHLQDGSVEENNGKFFVGEVKLHCVIPAKLATLKCLLQLTSAKANNGEELRPLTYQEIGEVAVRMGIVEKVPCKPVNGKFFFVDGEFYSVNFSGEEFAEFNAIMTEITKATFKVAKKVERRAQLSLQEQATCLTIEEAVENGGTYLAFIPDSQAGDRKFKGGKILLHFDKRNVTISQEAGQPFVSGDERFCNAVAEILQQSAIISIKDVKDLMENDTDKPARKMPKASFRLWHYIKSHIDWLFQQEEEAEAINSMQHEDDLSVEEFFQGKIGNIVLHLKKFVVNKVHEISPVAIRVSRCKVDDEPAIVVLEASPSMMPHVSNLVDNTYKEDGLPNILRQFFICWQKLNSEPTKK